MRPIIVPLTHKKVRRDPILGRDPWFGNLGHRVLAKKWNISGAGMALKYCLKVLLEAEKNLVTFEQFLFNKSFRHFKVLNFKMKKLLGSFFRGQWLAPKWLDEGSKILVFWGQPITWTLAQLCPPPSTNTNSSPHDSKVLQQKLFQKNNIKCKNPQIFEKSTRLKKLVNLEIWCQEPLKCLGKV